MKKIVLAIAVIVFAVIGITYYLNTDIGAPNTIRITYTFDDNRIRYNYIGTSCLKPIDNQNPDWQNTEPQTCGSANLPCVIEMSVNNRSLTAESCEFMIFAPGGLNGNPNPSFTTSKGWASDWALVQVDKSGKTESFVSPRNMQFQFIRNGKVLGYTKVSSVLIHIEPWGANFRATWDKG